MAVALPLRSAGLIIGIEPGQKHTGRGIHRTKRGSGLVLQFGKRLANQCDALCGGIDGGQLSLVVQGIGELQSLHQGAGAHGDYRGGPGQTDQQAQESGLCGWTLQLSGFVGGGTGISQCGRFKFASMFFGEFPCLGEVGVLRSVHN